MQQKISSIPGDFVISVGQQVGLDDDNKSKKS